MTRSKNDSGRADANIEIIGGNLAENKAVQEKLAQRGFSATAEVRATYSRGPFTQSDNGNGIRFIYDNRLRRIGEACSLLDGKNNRALRAETIANSNLFAASFEMIRALKEVSKWCEYNGCGVGHSAEPNWLEDVNAAIAKTEGTNL